MARKKSIEGARVLHIVAGTPTTNMEPLQDFLRDVAEEMDAGDWEEQETAVLITRDAEGFLTFCGWGEWGDLVAQAASTKRTT